MSEQIKIKQCVMCEKAATEKYRPFCSKRCADLDLGKWLNGSYVVAGSTQNDENDFSSDQLNEFDHLDR